MMLATLLAAVVAVLPTRSAIDSTAWTLDASHSSIRFVTTHMLISEVPGAFKDFQIEMHSSKDDFSDLQVQATIQAASITTDNDRRDQHLRASDFFDTATYPTITFASTRTEKTGDATFRIEGNLTIKNNTRPVVFNATMTGVLRTTRGTISGWKAETTIDRFDYGLTWNRTIETGGLVVGKDVRIIINAEFRR